MVEPAHAKDSKELEWFRVKVCALAKTEPGQPDETICYQMELEALDFAEAQLIAMLAAQVKIGDRFMVWRDAPDVEFGESPSWRQRYPLALSSRVPMPDDLVFFQGQINYEGVSGHVLTSSYLATVIEEHGPRYSVKLLNGKYAGDRIVVWYENLRIIKFLE